MSFVILRHMLYTYVGIYVGKNKHKEKCVGNIQFFRKKKLKVKVVTFQQTTFLYFKLICSSSQKSIIIAPQTIAPAPILMSLYFLSRSFILAGDVVLYFDPCPWAQKKLSQNLKLFGQIIKWLHKMKGFFCHQGEFS